MPGDPTAPQPPPTGQGREILPLVLADLQRKSAAGTAKYGTPLRAGNGRRGLVDAYQELLDLTMYLRQQLEEDRQVAAQARAAALEEAIAAAEMFLHAEPDNPAVELDRLAIYSNGTVRRVVAAIRALQGWSPAVPVPAAALTPLAERFRPRRLHGWVRRPGALLARCRNCPMERHYDQGPQGGVVYVYKLNGQELSRGPESSARVPPCRPPAGSAPRGTA